MTGLNTLSVKLYLDCGLFLNFGVMLLSQLPNCNLKILQKLDVFKECNNICKVVVELLLLILLNHMIITKAEGYLYGNTESGCNVSVYLIWKN